jgi:GTP-binding protein HflX
VAISALNGEGLDKLVTAVDALLPLDPVVRTTIRVPSGDGASIALLHEFGRVLATRYAEDFCELDVEVPQSLQRRLDRDKKNPQ